MNENENEHFLRGIFIAYITNGNELLDEVLIQEIRKYYMLSHSQFTLVLYANNIDLVVDHFLCALTHSYQIIQDHALHHSDYVVLFPQIFNNTIYNMHTYDVNFI